MYTCLECPRGRMAVYRERKQRFCCKNCTQSNFLLKLTLFSEWRTRKHTVSHKNCLPCIMGLGGGGGGGGECSQLPSEYYFDTQISNFGCCLAADCADCQGEPLLSPNRIIRTAVRKPTLWCVRPVKIQISLRIRADWSESSLGAF